MLEPAVMFLFGRERISVAQLTLMWVSAHMPLTADQILASARPHYERLAPLPNA
jgi:hypothetical protein